MLLVGLVVFRASARTRTRNVGRTAIGLGLMLLSLHLIVRDDRSDDNRAGSARADRCCHSRAVVPVIVLAALAAWAMHSSIAAILIIASLAHAGLTDPLASLAMVLGANLGSALNPLIGGQHPASGSGRAAPSG